MIPGIEPSDRWEAVTVIVLGWLFAFGFGWLVYRLVSWIWSIVL